MHNILLFGGTFDPIHYGHINTLIAVQKKFHFEQIVLIPCKLPALKDNPIALPEHRLAMLQLAIAETMSDYNITIDTSELERNTPSYTVITLKQYRKTLGKNYCICLLIGMDAFLTLPSWYQWENLIHLTNLLVTEREGYPNTPSPILQDFIKKYTTASLKELLYHPANHLYFYNAGHYKISSTHIRSAITKQNTKLALPASVLKYIAKKKIYLIFS